MKRRSEGELLALINEQLKGAHDYSTQTLRTIRAKSWNYFLNRPRGDEIEGRSQVQDTTIRDVHNAMVATIMPAYAADNIVQFEPVDEGDNEACDAESAAVNNIFTEDNSGYYQLQSAVSDALLHRNGVIKVWLDDEVETNVQRFAADPGMVKVALEEQGLEVLEIDTDEEGLTLVKTQSTRQNLKVEAIEPAWFTVDPNLNTQNLQDANFIAERTILRRWQLKDMGVSQKKINKCTALVDESVSQAGTVNTDITAKYVDGQPTHNLNSNEMDQRVECYWVHMRIDGERMRFLVSSDVLLLKDPCGFWPYSSGTAFPVAHRHSGLGLWDLLHQTQDAKTSILRQYLDNLNIANNQRPIYDPATTNEQDILAGAPGRGIRSTDPAAVGFVPVMDMSSNSLAGLQYMDDVTGRQAGAALDMQAGDSQIVREASGLSVDMQLSAKEQLASQASRNLAETLVRDMFLLIHRTLREQYTGEITYRYADQWIKTQPGSWRPRNRLNVSIGLSPGDRRRHKAALQQVLEYQFALIQGGAANISTNWRGVYAALNDWMLACELDGAEGYFLNPDGQESMQGQQSAAEQQQQAEAMQQQFAQIEAQFEQLKLEQDDRHHQDQLQFDYWKEQLEAQIEEAKLVQQGTDNELNRRASAAAAETAGNNGANGSDARSGSSSGSGGRQSAGSGT